MDALIPDIRETAPTDPAVSDLIDRHLTLMRASSPACSVHAMDADSLAEASARFFLARLDGMPVAMGAIKSIDASHGELKSMHVLSETRGRGLGKSMLEHLLGIARDDGFERVSLETGSQAAFAPARSLYLAAGFQECPAFEGYGPDPNSVFLTLEL
ncbi:MAG: GNAT family N-acetyltransferase [Dinoroseobacter sp.]|nr:GNAT family N-acetyltransferase [Dinoroseobacter sp.]